MADVQNAAANNVARVAGQGANANAARRDDDDIADESPAAQFLRIFGNGPVETALSLGAEKFDQKADGAIKGATLVDTYCLTLASIAADREKPSKFERAVAGAAVAAHSGRFGAVAGWFSVDAEAEEYEGDDGDEYGDDDIATAIQDGISLVAATKVNWWKCNHHTGGSIATGFTARAINVISDGAEKIDADSTRLAWRAGHWFDTRIWIASLGIAHVELENRQTFPLAIDDAIKKRIRSAPAGTAAFEAVIAGLIFIIAHPVLSHANCPNFVGLSQWFETHEDIKENAAYYHIGSAYLTGKVQRKVPDVPGPIISFVATCIRFANKEATLLKAAVFKGVSDDATTSAAIRNASAFAKTVRTPIGINKWVVTEAPSDAPAPGAGGANAVNAPAIAAAPPAIVQGPPALPQVFGDGN